MGHSTARRIVSRTGAAACLAAGLAVFGGGAAGADPLPAPVGQAADLSAVLEPQAQDADGGPDTAPEPSSTGPLDGVTSRLGVLLPGGDGTGGSDEGSGTVAGEPAGGDGAGQGNRQAGGQADGQRTAQGHAQGETAPATASTTPRDQPKAGARVASDALTACVIPTGSGSPAVEFDLSVLGNDAGRPLAEAIPQAFTPCPEGAVPAEDSVVGADVDVEGLLGACVRVTREVAPLQTTLVVLDQDVIAALTDAGLPLEQLVVPCPSGSTEVVTPAAPGSSGSSDPTDRPASAVPSLPGRLAFTGADTVPLASLAVVLLSLGVLLIRRARRLRPCASRG
jgi:hypothetical protein